MRIVNGTGAIRINARLAIPRRELVFVFSRAAGPGGQNVNKVNTRATLLFDVARSPSLGDEQRARIVSALATRITKEGILRVTSQKHRTQKANREEALARFETLLRGALERRRARRPTVPTPQSRRRRLEHKRRAGRLKAQRTSAYERDE